MRSQDICRGTVPAHQSVLFECDAQLLEERSITVGLDSRKSTGMFFVLFQFFSVREEPSFMGG